MNKKKDVTILVNSCDKYEDLWYPFFEMLRIQWPSLDYPIILNTEGKKYIHSHKVGREIRCLQLFKNISVDWSTRMLKTIEYVDTEFVLMMLDDNYSITPVNQDGFEKTLQIMMKHPNILCINFTPMFGHNDGKSSLIYNDLLVIKRTNGLQYSADCALWRTKGLRRVLLAGESIGQFEINTKRRRKLFERVYMYKEGHSPIDIRQRINFGYGVSGGKWMYNNEALFKRYGINADLTKREHYSKVEIDERMKKYRSSVSVKKPLKLRLRQRIEEYIDSVPDIWCEYYRKIKRVLFK